ncbi:SurA N-terminal domain-containing protein [Saccharopolyspora cebuensis]|uniref:SurA N-terminal domain-containing protein n=1 Tax=Saccharopolyspora cebuensis TaxID=418759 RepID=A0ABV4CB44_9PSEU
MPRRGRLLALLATAGALLVGCSGPSHAGAAAIIGDTRIPVSDVQSWMDEVMRKEPAATAQLQQQDQLDDLGRQLASQLVVQELAAHAAREESLAVTPEQVNARIDRMGGPRAATEGGIYTEGNVRDAVRAQLLATELGRKYFDRLAVTIDYTQATTRADAQRKAERMAEGPEQATALVAADRRTGVPAVADQRLRAADSPQLAAMTPLFGAEPGTVLAFEPEPNSGQWLIARIDHRSTEATGPPSGADDQLLQQFGFNLLGHTAQRAGLELSPRYGVWDAIALTAAPGEGQTTGWRIEPADRQS